MSPQLVLLLLPRLFERELSSKRNRSLGNLEALQIVEGVFPLRISPQHLEILAPLHHLRVYWGYHVVVLVRIFTVVQSVEDARQDVSLVHGLDVSRHHWRSQLRADQQKRSRLIFQLRKLQASVHLLFISFPFASLFIRFDFFLFSSTPALSS